MGLRNSGGRGQGSSVRPGSVAPAGPPRPGEVAPVPRAPRPSASLPKTRRAGWCVAAAPGCKGRRRPRLCPLRTHPLPSWLHRAAPPARRAPRTRARARRPRPLSCAPGWRGSALPPGGARAQQAKLSEARAQGACAAEWGLGAGRAPRQRDDLCQVAPIRGAQKSADASPPSGALQAVALQGTLFVIYLFIYLPLLSLSAPNRVKGLPFDTTGLTERAAESLASGMTLSKRPAEEPRAPQNHLASQLHR